MAIPVDLLNKVARSTEVPDPDEAKKRPLTMIGAYVRQVATSCETDSEFDRMPPIDKPRTPRQKLAKLREEAKHSKHGVTKRDEKIMSLHRQLGVKPKNKRLDDPYEDSESASMTHEPPGIIEAVIDDADMDLDEDGNPVHKLPNGHHHNGGGHHHQNGGGAGHYENGADADDDTEDGDAGAPALPPDAPVPAAAKPKPKKIKAKLHAPTASSVAKSKIKPAKKRPKSKSAGTGAAAKGAAGAAAAEAVAPPPPLPVALPEPVAEEGDVWINTADDDPVLPPAAPVPEEPQLVSALKKPGGLKKDGKKSKGVVVSNEVDTKIISRQATAHSDLGDEDEDEEDDEEEYEYDEEEDVKPKSRGGGENKHSHDASALTASGLAWHEEPSEVESQDGYSASGAKSPRDGSKSPRDGSKSPRSPPPQQQQQKQDQKQDQAQQQPQEPASRSDTNSGGSIDRVTTEYNPQQHQEEEEEKRKREEQQQKEYQDEAAPAPVYFSMPPERSASGRVIVTQATKNLTMSGYLEKYMRARQKGAKASSSHAMGPSHSRYFRVRRDAETGIVLLSWGKDDKSMKKSVVVRDVHDRGLEDTNEMVLVTPGQEPDLQVRASRAEQKASWMEVLRALLSARIDE